jgi:hypothetical protein
MSIESEYHEQGTKMRMQEIGIVLNAALGDLQRDAQHMRPYDVALFLSISSEALINYIRNSNEQLAEDDPGYINTIAIEKIRSIFSELSNNFFPMAHTNGPLEQLKIIDREQIHQIRNTFNEFRAIEEARRYQSENLRRIDEERLRLSDELRAIDEVSRNHSENLRHIDLERFHLSDELRRIEEERLNHGNGLRHIDETILNHSNELRHIDERRLNVSDELLRTIEDIID